MSRFNNTLPRYIIFLTDTLISIFSVILAYELRFNFRVPVEDYAQFGVGIAFLVSVRITTFFIFSSYKGMVQYTSSEDALRIFYTVTTGTVFIGTCNFIGLAIHNQYLVPFSVLIIDYFFAMLFMMGFRVGVKMLVEEVERIDKIRSTVFIYGVGKEAILTKHSLEKDLTKRYQIIAFLMITPLFPIKKLRVLPFITPIKLWIRCLKSINPGNLLLPRK